MSVELTIKDCLEKVRNEATTTKELKEIMQCLSLLKLDLSFFQLIRSLVKHPSIDPYEDLLTLSRYYANLNTFAWDFENNCCFPLILLEIPDLATRIKRANNAVSFINSEDAPQARLVDLKTPKECPKWFKQS